MWLHMSLAKPMSLKPEQRLALLRLKMENLYFFRRGTNCTFCSTLQTIVQRNTQHALETLVCVYGSMERYGEIEEKEDSSLADRTSPAIC